MARRPATPWESQIRKLIKATHGMGWSLGPHRGGRTQISRRWSDGTRSSVTIGVPWAASSGPVLLATIERLAAVMADQTTTLAQAAALVDVAGAKGSAASIREGAIDWGLARERYEQHLVGNGTVKPATWRKTYRKHTAEALVALASKPAPRTGQAVLAAVLAAHPTPSGCSGRRERLGNVARFLQFAVDHCGSPTRFAPPLSRKPLVGNRLDAKRQGTPLRDDQFLRLYRAIEDPRWRLAAGLMGVFGLRPAELTGCRAVGGRLRVVGVKRNAAGGAAPGRGIEPLDPVGAPGLGGQLLAMLAERGAEALPKTPHSWSTVMQQHLTRKVPAWAALMKEAATTEQGHLTIYSFRHGFAWRGGQTYGITPRVLAALMGHTVAVHLKHYGEGAAADEVAAAVAAARRRLLASTEIKVL